MQSPSAQKTSNNTIALKRLRSNEYSGRHRPGSRARHSSQHEITTSALPKQYPPSAQDFPPLGFTLLTDSSEFGNTSVSEGVSRASISGTTSRSVDEISTSNSTGTAAKREGNIGMETQMNMNIAANSSRRNTRPKSISANYSTPIGEFMGGKRGEMTQDRWETASYKKGRQQYSRRGNPLPSHSNTTPTIGISTQSNNATCNNTNSTPNPFSMTAAAGTSLTHRSAPYEISKNFDRLRIQGAHLGLISSPYFPKCKEDLVKHREGRKNDARDVMNQRIRDKEEVMRLKSERAYVKIKNGFLGKVFRDDLSGVLGRRSIWGCYGGDGEGGERVEWPTLQELKLAGVRKMGLPVPRYRGEDGMVGEEVKVFACDRVGLDRTRAEEIVMFDEQDIKKIGQMARLFEAIDG